LSFATEPQSRTIEVRNKTSTPVKRPFHYGAKVNSAPMAPHDSIIQLQQTIGNQAVQMIMRSNDRNDSKKTSIQARLKISHPGDVYEQEADRVAEQVMRMSDSVHVDFATSREERIDRKCSMCEMKKEGEEENRKKKRINISRKSSTTSNPQVSDELTSEIGNVRTSSSSALDNNTQEFMESRFGYDFSNVRIHTDEKAAESAQSVNASAYTIGQDIIFGRGRYSPRTYEGRRLLAHELTHVLQQGSDPGIQSQTTRGTIQRLDIGNLGGILGGGVTGLLDPLGPVFDGVVSTNVMVASYISIPRTWFNIVQDFSTVNKEDGALLLAALARGPSFYSGGWILDIQSGAEAMTLDRSIFVSGRLRLSTFVHELVHVRQYRILGRTGFLVSYFGTSAGTIAWRWLKRLPLNPMESSPHEKQAYDLADRFRSWYMSKYNSDPIFIYA
jgi:Domain of unknown function (DUF4157)